MGAVNFCCVSAFAYDGVGCFQSPGDGAAMAVAVKQQGIVNAVKSAGSVADCKQTGNYLAVVVKNVHLSVNDNAAVYVKQGRTPLQRIERWIDNGGEQLGTLAVVGVFALRDYLVIARDRCLQVFHGNAHLCCQIFNSVCFKAGAFLNIALNKLVNAVVR